MVGVTARQVLKEALAVIARAHTPVQLSTDLHGAKVRNPLNQQAAAWSSVGALIKVAPADAKITAEHLAPGHLGAAWQAFLLLEQAARQQGFVNTVQVDEAGLAAAQRMFWRALQLCDDEPRRRPLRTVGTGGAPRGAAS